MARWSQEGIPHKGWRYVDVEDVCEGLSCYFLYELPMIIVAVDLNPQ